MFYSVNSYSSISSRKGVGGLMSGLDTDELVKNMTIGTRTKIATQLQKKQLAQWKQEAYRGITDTINSFKRKWFSSSSSTSNILDSNFFNSKKITSSSEYVKISGKTEAAENLVIKDIMQTAETAAFTSSKKVSSGVIRSGEIAENWPQSNINGESIKIVMGTKQHTISIGSNFNFKASDIGNNTAMLKAVVNEFNTAISNSDDLKGKLEFSVNADNKIEIKSLDGSEFSVTEVGDNLKAGLGLSGTLPTNVKSFTGDTTSASSMYTMGNLGDALSGTTLTVSFNGVEKQIKFDASKKTDYDDVDGLRTYLQGQLDKAYGAGKVQVGFQTKPDGNGGTTNAGIWLKTASDTDTFTVKSSDAENVLGGDGALGILPGTTNRISWVQNIDTLIKSSQFADSSSMTPDADGNFKLKINDVEITVNKKDTMRDLLNKINESEAGVRVTYSTTADAFTMTAKESGANGRVDVQSTGGSNDIGQFLFGTTAQQNHTVGQDAIMEVSFDGGKTSTTVTRSTNAFSIDGLNIELTGKAEDTKLVDLAGTSFVFNFDGASHTLTLPSDFKINDNLSNDDKVKALIAGLNTELSKQGLSGDLSFALVQNGGKTSIEFKSSDPNKMITLDTGTSSATLMNAMGFRAHNGDGSDSITGAAGFEMIEAVKEDIKFNVENDSEAFTKKFKEFIEDYNKMIKSCNDLTTEKQDREYKPLTEEQKEEMSEDEVKKWQEQAKKGILQNDRIINSFMDNMRSALFAPVDGSSFHLNNMGISTTEWKENGQIHITNEDMFDKAIAENSEQIIKMFTAKVEPVYPEGASKTDKLAIDRDAALKSGLAVRMEYFMNVAASTSIGAEGTLVRMAGDKSDYKLSQDNISREIKRYDSALNTLKKRLKAEEERYFKQFSTLERYLSQMNAQSSWLTEQFGGGQ